MEHRTKRNHPLQDLVSEFEAMTENGNMAYLEEKTFFQLISYYEDDFQLDRALEVTDYAIAQYSYSADFLMIKARLFLLKDKPFKALKFLEKAEVISPFEVEVILLRARIFSELGDFEQALMQVEEAKKYCTGSDLVELYISESAVYESMKDFDLMFASLKKALQIDPVNEEALERIWVCVEFSKNYEESIDLHLNLIERDAYSYLAWFNLGHAYSCIGEYLKAIDAIEYSFLINANFELGYLDCAELCCQTSRFERALSIYTEMIERFDDEEEHLVKVAECLIKLDRHQEAKTVLIDLLKMDQYNDEIYYFLGQCFYHEGKYTNAASSFQKAIDLEDRREEYYAELAQAYYKLEEYAKADYSFRKATETGPEQDIYWIQHVEFLFAVGKTKKALEVLDEAEFHAVGADLQYCRAACLIRLNKRKKAIKVLDEALSEDYQLHPTLFRFCPELEIDKEIHSMLKYYQGEKVNIS
jgi:tetratricopeptide (TPR) repeat protein